MAETSDIEPVPQPQTEAKKDVTREIHKPKVVHYWRELLTEIGVVVIGVGIALIAQQTVEWLQWRGQVADARNVIGNELGQAMAQGIERVRSEKCIEQRLDTLALILDEASRKRALPPVPQIGQPSNRPWQDDVWQTTVSSQTATHFPQDLINRMGSIYSQVRQLRENNREEQLAWANLGTMIGPGRRLDPPSEAELRTAMSQARYYNRFMALAGGQIVGEIEGLGLAMGSDAGAFVDEALHRKLSDSPICKPLSGTASAEYGQAQLSNTLNSFADWQKYPPYAAKAPRK